MKIFRFIPILAIFIILSGHNINGCVIGKSLIDGVAGVVADKKGVVAKIPLEFGVRVRSDSK